MRGHHIDCAKRRRVAGVVCFLFNVCALQLEQPKPVFEHPPKHFRQYAFSIQVKIHLESICDFCILSFRR